MEACQGCGAEFMPIDGPTHPYMLSSTACWQHYEEILAREYESQELFKACHRLTVDAYALQHIGADNDPRASQSVQIHYISLHMIFAHGKSQTFATDTLKTLAAKPFSALTAETPSFEMTVKDMSLATLENHA